MDKADRCWPDIPAAVVTIATFTWSVGLPAICKDMDGLFEKLEPSAAWTVKVEDGAAAGVSVTQLRPS